MAGPQKITTYLWFNGDAEEAVDFYTSVFADSRVTHVARWGEGGPGPQGTVLNIVFELAGQRFIALNGGPQFTFTPAISLFVSCESQAEVDEGHRAIDGHEPYRRGLANEAIRVTHLLSRLLPDHPEVSSLLALMLHKDAGRAASDRAQRPAMMATRKANRYRLRGV